MEQQFTKDVTSKLKQKRYRRIWRRILSVMMCIVVFCTTYAMILPAITKTTATFCGIEEHTHKKGCFEDTGVLICSLGHAHSEGCYESKLTCEQNEHTHSLQCYSDPSADAETESDWKATLPKFEFITRQNASEVAKSQLGYTESDKNYKVGSNGSISGYTRYGAWHGDPYVDWNSTFVAFCLYYSGIDYTYNSDYAGWVTQLESEGRYKAPSEHVPRASDIVFLDTDKNGTADRVGIISSVKGVNFTAIEGDCAGRVAEKSYNMFDKSIAGYGVVEIYRPTGDAGSKEEKPSEEVTEPEGSDAWAELVPSDKGEGDTGENEPQISAPQGAGASSRSLLALSDSATTYAQTRAAPLDLTPYIESVTMYDEDGNKLESGSVVTEGDLIEFRIEYTIDGQQLAVMNGETVDKISDTLTYKLPEIFKMIQSGSGNIINSVGQVVGTYNIDNETGIITLRFDEEYVEQNAKGIQIQGFISFFSLVTKITDSDSEDQEYEFTDNIILGVVIEEKQEAVGDLSIEKNKTSVNGEEITYEVIVTSKEGTNGSITITDQMSKGLTFKEGIEVLKGNTAVRNVRFTPSSDRSSFTITLPEMAAGESYVVRYKCTADIELLDADMTVRNTAKVNGKDSQGRELEDETTVDHVFDMLKKTGVLNDDGTITWSITINTAKADISGWTLEDVITTANGSSAYSGRVTIRNSNGSVLASNVRLPYTFPSGSTGTYVVSYTTSHSFADGDVITNRAVLRDDDTDVTVVTGVGVGSPITKTGTAGELILSEDGTYLLPITWTVTVDTTNGAIPGGEFFYDKMEGYPSNNMVMTYEQLMAALANIEAEIIRAGSNEAGWFEAAEYQAGYGHGDLYGYWDLVNNVNNSHDRLYERFVVILDQPIPKGQILTFTYETYGLFDNNVVAGSVYKNRFNISEHYEVEGKVDFTSGSVKATKYALSYFDPDVHGNNDWHWDITHWNSVEGTGSFEYEKLHDNYLGWAIELSVPPAYWGSGDIVLIEDLPEGVSVDSLALSFASDVPTQTLRQRNMSNGQTYTWDFTLYPPDQYGSWRPQGGQTVSITIKVTDEGDLEFTIPGIIFETMAQYTVIQNQWQPEGAKLEEWYGYLYIYTKIDEDFDWTPTSENALVYVDAFENRFTLLDEDGDVLDIGSQTQVITKDESSGIIRKEAYTDNNNIITYSVILNAYKKDLIENSGTLAVHDELTYPSTEAQPLRLRLVPGSVKLYEIKLSSDGSYTKLGEVNINYSYNEASSTRYGTTTWVHTIDLTVPDSKSLLLEYSYRATGGKNVTHSVANTCTIRGVGEGGLEGDHKVEIEVKEATAQADTKGVMIYKVDAGSNGIFLENARFNIYIWNKEKNAYIIVHHPENGGTDFTTDMNGMIVLDGTTMAEDQFAYNTAYYIVEVASPDGYYLGPEPYYFYIANPDTSAYPSCIPNNFKGDALTSGDIIYRDNVSEITKIRVEKYWKGYDGDFMTVKGDRVPSITLELWQMLKGNPNSAKRYGTYTVSPDADGNWSIVIDGLPKAVKNSDGTKGTDYLYYIKEVGAGGFTLESAENNDGINSGTIRLVNREKEGYDLPDTGGIGTEPYTTAGILLTLFSAAFLLYINRKRERRRL